MRALLAQAAFVEDENAMRVLNGAEPVRDDDGGATLQQPVERLADHQLGLRVHAGRGFVENQQSLDRARVRAQS